MDGFPVLEFPEGSVSFNGTIRIDDLGIKEFEIQLPGRPMLYGQWVPRFEQDEKHYSAVVVSFGYAHEGNVTNPHPEARVQLTGSEVRVVAILIGRLFSDKTARSEVFPFGSGVGLFNERVELGRDWVLLHQPG